jgi:SagB-type dehydrogenase family enzyme
MYKEKVGHLIIAATFGRTRFKYGTRGYRFALLEAGHVAQSVVMLSEAQGMLSACLGGYYDDKIDVMLRLDGINETSVYILALSRVP